MTKNAFDDKKLMRRMLGYNQLEDTETARSFFNDVRLKTVMLLVFIAALSFIVYELSTTNSKRLSGVNTLNWGIAGVGRIGVYKTCIRNKYTLIVAILKQNDFSLILFDHFSYFI